jgi:hypothetical protein
MKKKTFKMLIIMFMIGISPTFSVASESSNPTPGNPAISQVSVLMERLEEINKMDKSSLSRHEKKELRNEVKEMQRVASRSGEGIYLSVGAIIIILLVLIILL